MDYSKKISIVHMFLLVVCFILIVLSFLNIRGINNNDNKDIVSYKQNINTCCYIILSLSFLVLIRSLYNLFKIKEGEPVDPSDNIYSVIQGVVVYLFPFILLVLSIIIKANVSNILPDPNNKDDVDKFNKNNWSIDNIQNSSNGLLVMSIILFLLSIIYFVYRKYYGDDKPDISKQTVYDKQMEFFKKSILKAENEFDGAQNSGTATKDWLRNKANYIQQLKLKMLSLSKQREEEVQRNVIQNLQTYEQYSKALDEAKERTQDEIMFEAARGSVDVESIVPEHLQDVPMRGDLKIRTAPRSISSTPSISSIPSISSTPKPDTVSKS